MPKVLNKKVACEDTLYTGSILETLSEGPQSPTSLVSYYKAAGVSSSTIKSSLHALVAQGKIYADTEMNLCIVNRSQAKRITKSTKKVNPLKDTYKLPKPVLLELSKIMAYNDSCTNVNLRVTREETVLLLNQYGWAGSSSSLNRLLKANFGRSFTGSYLEVSKTKRAR